ncbi:hypothetical protein QR680_001882 [Steinernema hermaphroditum]|uniref:DUF4211 domain-containing protein n=1 Tax=Steinernema hermaphroditum TaxID=289476 RepID=A0AA39LH34_9BILA|nr:hypothetical protein QR680_001882 [Steinernema hermaphroditum]
MQAKVAAMLPMYGMLPQSVASASDPGAFTDPCTKSLLTSVPVGFDQTERLEPGGSSSLSNGIDHSAFDDLSWTKDINLDDFHLNYDSTADFHALLGSDLSSDILKTDTQKSKDRFKADDFEKEFERHMNAVANNDVESNSLPIFDAFSSILATDIPNTAEPREKISLTPVQFTPPDSPSDDVGLSGLSKSLFNFDIPSTSKPAAPIGAVTQKPSVKETLDTLSFIPKINPSKQATKVPVYKQRTQNPLFLFNEKEKSDKADAFDFSDDDEEESALSSFFSKDLAKDQKASSLLDKNSILGGPTPFTIAEQRMESKSSVPKSTVADSIRKRRETRALGSFLHAESLEKDCSTVFVDATSTTSSNDFRSPKNKDESSADENYNGDLPPLPKFRKRRLIMQWNEGEPENGEMNNENRKRARISPSLCEVKRAERTEVQWDPHLIKFSQAHGNLGKGTFVVSKQDLFRIECCALWRVDNQNLLQKYPPIIDPKTGRTMYKNSSTYSGWCDQIADGYLTVVIKYMKHSRAESIVEPEIPLVDLFPAISQEVEDRATVAADEVEKDECVKEMLCFGKDALRVSLQTYLQVMLNHALSLNFLQSIKQANEWNYLCSLNEVDKANEDGKARIRERVKWNQHFVDMVQQYSFCTASDSDVSDVFCQACDAKPISNVIQLFSNEYYNYETLAPIEFPSSGRESPMPAMEFLVCSSCQQYTLLYHRLHHLRYHLLKKCEDKIETMSIEYPTKSAAEVIDACMRQTRWVKQICDEYVADWKKVGQL